MTYLALEAPNQAPTEIVFETGKVSKRRQRVIPLSQPSSWGSISQPIPLFKMNRMPLSQDCSGCGERVEKSLSVRTHVCTKCGLILDRDENAAKNIQWLGQSLRGVPAVAGTVNREPVGP